MTTPAVLSDVLVLLADLDDARILPRRTVSIAVERVLAWSWNPGRLERCQRLLAEGEKAPPIHVNRYRLNGLTWYVVSDGRHRTVAAREAGRTTHRRCGGQRDRLSPWPLPAGRSRPATLATTP
jgi:hypothetical protein